MQGNARYPHGMQGNQKKNRKKWKFLDHPFCYLQTFSDQATIFTIRKYPRIFIRDIFILNLSTLSFFCLHFCFTLIFREDVEDKVAGVQTCERWRVRQECRPGLPNKESGSYSVYEKSKKKRKSFLSVFSRFFEWKLNPALFHANTQLKRDDRPLRQNWVILGTSSGKSFLWQWFFGDVEKSFKFRQTCATRSRSRHDFSKNTPFALFKCWSNVQYTKYKRRIFIKRKARDSTSTKHNKNLR